ncbi:structural contituent of cuticle [Holotrichia oblita]|uniref:Structural contituent of cuticle n=1 Tax=Holotrichia oblita TaxID=644536 RepID=A0ACB9TC44_HOLOL|nr:structural contituent of cuticle [Holotrichia oblita]
MYSLVQTFIVVALAAFISAIPIEEHLPATSYSSTSSEYKSEDSDSDLSNLEQYQFGELGLDDESSHVTAPIYTHTEDHHEEDHEPKKYEFHYAVEDKHTGDIKSQKESGDGHVVKGEYSLKEADGTTRIVKYSADKKNGFNAVVIKKGHAVHPEVVHKNIFAEEHEHDQYEHLISHY